MNNSMNILKRMMAFLLAMLLLTTMMGDDFSSLADSDLDMVTETIQDDGAAADVETTEGETADTATPEPEVTEEVTEPVETEPEVTEPEVTDPEVTDEVTNSEEINIDDSQNIDKTDEILPEEEVPEEDAAEECEHDWKAVSNDDGTHTWVCTKCEEQGETEDCEFGEDGICIHCGYEQPAEEEECDHEWEYTSNDDGTHTKRCTKCGEEEVEDCEFDEDWVCVHCKYEDMSLEYQEYSKTIHGVKVTVAGEMPRKSKVTIYTKSLKKVNDIVNETIDEGTFEAYEAFDITIYDRHGDKYQPKDDGNSVSVTFEGVSELADTPDEEIVAYRIEDDQETVTEIPTDVAGEDVSFDAEHFSTYVVGSINTESYITIYPDLIDGIGYLKENDVASTYTSPYIRIKSADFRIYADTKGTYTFTATVYKNVSTSKALSSATAVATGTKDVTASSIGWIDVSIPVTVKSGADEYIAYGDNYAVIIEATATPNGYVDFGYGNGSVETYILEDGWENDAPAGVFTETTNINDSTNYNVEVVETPSDSYTITSITGPDPSSATSSAEQLNPYTTDTYLYSVGDTGTFTATLSNTSATRTITWSTSNSDVVSVNATTGAFEAKKSGEAKITATYKSSTKSITVKVIEFTIADSDDGTTPSVDYAGEAIVPTVVAYSDKDQNKTVSVERSASNNTNATTNAKLAISYTPVSGKTYTFNRTFTISKLALSSAAFTDATTMTIESGAITAIDNIDPTNAVYGVKAKPVFGKDFTATYTTATTIAGKTYTVSIVATSDGNFSGSTKWTKTVTADAGLTVEFSSNSALENCTYTGDKLALASGWPEVVFKDSEGQVVDYVNSETADYVITDRSGATSDAILTNAGEKTITFTIKDGYGLAGTTLSLDFEMKKADIGAATINWINPTFNHDGNEHKAKAGTDFTVIFNEKTVSEDEYSVSYDETADYVNITGSSKIPTVIITGAGKNFDSESKLEGTYKIVASYANDMRIRITVGSNNYDGTKENNYVIPYTMTYDGSSTRPSTIRMYMNGTYYTVDTDFTLTILDKNSTELTPNAGTKVITATPTSTGALKDYVSSPITAYYEIGARSLTTSMVDLSKLSSKTYTGSAITLTTATSSSSSTDNYDIKVSYGSTVLTESKDGGTTGDYILTCENNTNAGTATFYIEGVGNFTGKLTSSSYKFTIDPAELSLTNTDVTKAYVTWKDSVSNLVYNGSEFTPAVKFIIGSNDITNKITENVDYTVKYDNNISVGTETATVTVTGSNNLTGSVILKFSILSNTSSAYTIKIKGDYEATYLGEAKDVTAGSTITRYYTSDVPITYTGTAFNGSVAVYLGSTKLTYKTDYKYSYINATNAKIYKEADGNSNPYLYITGQGNYKGSNAIVYLSINPIDISSDDVTVTLSEKNNFEKAYTGSDVALEDLVVSVNNKELTVSTDGGTTGDYTVTYNATDKKSAGEKTITITGINNYKGAVDKTYTVGTDISQGKVSILGAYYDANNNVQGEDYACILGEISTLEANPVSLMWRNSQAPKVLLYDKNGTKIYDADDDTVGTGNVSTPTIKSSLDLTGDKLYDAREAKGTGASNLITMVVSGDTSIGFYGTAKICYYINPQPLGGQRVNAIATKEQHYTGSDITVDPAFIFTYSYSDTKQVYTTVEAGHSMALTSDDYTCEGNIGSTVGTNATLTVTGVGNYSGDASLGFKIVEGYENVYVDTIAETQLVGTTNAASNEFTIADTAHRYMYTGEPIEPKIIVTNMSGTPLSSTEYSITYANNVEPTTADNLATATITVNSSNYATKTITVKYAINTNAITGFYGTMSDVTYTQTTLDLNAINTLINTNKVEVHLYETKGGKELTRGTDYEIIGVETTSLPSYQTSYLTVKGLNTYSGTEKIYFNIVLDLTSTTGSNSLASVSFASSRNLLVNEDTIVPTIKYKTLNSTEYDGTIPTTISIDGKDEPTYSIARTNPGEPGEDPAVSVTGQYLCVNTASHVLAADGSEIYFLADLATYSGISLKATTIEYTGSVLDPTTLFNGLLGNAGSADTNGDYTISYNYKKTSSATETSNPDDAKEVGVYNVVVTATDNSKYYAKDSNTGARFTFYIKYNLTNATIKIYDEANNEITETSYTGSAFSIVDHVKVFVKDTSEASKTKVIYHKASSLDSNAYISVTPATVTNIDTYTIKAQKATGYDDVVYGEKTLQFDVSGVSLKTKGTFTITTPDDGFIYTGSGIEPKVTGTVDVGGTPKTLTEGKDFSVTYYNNTNATNGGDKAYIGITGLGSYKCPTFYPDSLKFEIEKLDLSDTDHVVVEVEDATYSGYFLDPTTGGDKVKLTPDYAVYYVDKANGIKNKLQVQTGTTTTGDYYAPGVVDGSFYSNNTVAANSTDTNAPKLTVTAGASGNTKNSASGTFNIKKLDLNSGSVSFAQRTAEYTGGEIDVANIVKMTTSYTDASGNVVTVPLTQKGAYQAVDDTKCDYNVTIKKGNTNITNGKVTEVGTYTIEISGLNSCESSITDTFTVTERSLSSNYHYYYSAGNGFQGTWTYKSDLDTNTTTAEPGYITTGGLKDSAGNITDTLTIMVYDVVTKDANGGDNVPKIAITDVYKGAGTNGADVTYELVQNKDFTLSVENAKDTGSAEWSATVTDDKHAPVASTSPKVIITGKGTYTGTLELPFNIGKNLNNLGITVTYRYGSNTYEYNTSENNPEKFKDQWTYDYDSKAHKPVVVSVGSISAKNYTVTYTDESGNTDACINAGYKKIVITGEGDYCGTITQTYKVNKRKISDSTTSLFETQNPMQSSDGMLQFTISGTNLSRMTAADVQTYLVDTGKIKTTDTDNQGIFVGYYYTTYDGATVKPTVKIEDLGLNTVVDNTKDVKITYEPDCGTASTFIYEGSTLKYTTSTINIEFRTDNDAENVGNYYAPTNPITFTIKFIILEDALSDFDVKFVNGTDDNMYDYADGDEIEPEVTVFNNKRELELGTDYTLKYDDNVMPGKATVKVTGIGNYSGDKSLNFYITGDLSKTSVYYYDENNNFVKAGDDIGPVQTYHGEGITKGDPQMYLVLERDGGNPVDDKLTYDVEYSCVKSDSGTRTGEVTYRGITDASKDIYWSGDKTVTFNVDFDISNIGITNYRSEYQYTGYPIIPAFKLDYSESVASIEDITYKRDGNVITYTGKGETVTEAPDFVEPGTIEATINYEVNGEAGSKTIKYKITPRNVSVAESDTSYCTVVLASEQRYTGLPVIPSYTIFITSYNLQTDKKQIFKKLVKYDSETGVGDYEISYPTNKPYYSTSNEDFYTFTLTGKGGRLTGTYTKSYTIKLQSVANLVVTSKTSESISVEWVRDIFSDGTTLTLEKINSSGDYEVIKIAGAAKSTTYTFTGLTGSTTYRVSATAYANDPDGTTLHSEAETVETTTDISTSSFDANSYETGNATLTWSTTGNVTIYYIYRAEDETSEGKLVAILPASTGAYTNTKLTSGQTYYYHIDGYGRVNGVRQKITESEHKPVTIK
ncbi:hypothetical protein SAMN02910413_2491 [Pseudobutyrivibrio sp. C4]|uniref:hypothetical protein n=1 Tax=Pseudobutyrivibrio sp. C4 TaxID=1520803 RepID=UPI0008B196A9|nr:hypothetical protein [Pseudobutyrivibrio sp. C4]SET31172.1 hypothetical protein SAMN02910413_2491 [Pseudobutyrivibrio sp. C4]